MQDKIKTAEHLASPQNYSERVDTILATPLTIENVDTYAEDALNQLIDVIEDAKKQYNRQPTLSLDDNLTPKEQEDIVASYFGIPEIGVLIDFVVSRSLQLDLINSFINNIPESNAKILPTDRISVKKRPYVNGTFEKTPVVPKLKTLLFILENEFGINISDHEQVNIIAGAVPERSMRKEKYYSVEVKPIGRTILICDEQKNITYVFDSDMLNDLGISTSDLSEMSKIELQDLIKSKPIGSSVSQTAKFTSKLVLALKKPSTLIESEDTLENPKYLVIEHPPEGHLSVNGIANDLGVSHITVSRVVDDLKLIPDGRYIYDSTYAYGYGPEKRILIENRLIENGVFSENVPEGYLSINRIATNFGVDHLTVKNAVIELGLENDGVYKIVNSPSKVYCPEKIEKIYMHLVEKGIFASDAPEGYLNVALISTKFKLSPQVINNAISELGLEPDDKYRFDTKITYGYNPEKIEQIRIYLVEKNILVELAPEGYMSVGGMSVKFKVDNETIKRAINKLGIEPDGTYKNKARVTEFYNSDKVALIEQYINKRRRNLGKNAIPDNAE